MSIGTSDLKLKLEASLPCLVKLKYFGPVWLVDFFNPWVKAVLSRVQSAPFHPAEQVH